jgi:hypothetical protein
MFFSSSILFLILGVVRRLPEIVVYNKFDDDLFDRLNYSHTVVILTIFAIIVTNRQFSENQIKCWVCILLFLKNQNFRFLLLGSCSIYW